MADIAWIIWQRCVRSIEFQDSFHLRKMKNLDPDVCDLTPRIVCVTCCWASFPALAASELSRISNMNHQHPSWIHLDIPADFRWRLPCCLPAIQTTDNRVGINHIALYCVQGSFESTSLWVTIASSEIIVSASQINCPEAHQHSSTMHLFDLIYNSKNKANIHSHANKGIHAQASVMVFDT